ARNLTDAASPNGGLERLGHGDGDRGREAEMVESAQSLGVAIGKAIDFVGRAPAGAHDLARLRGELYLELHRGTYTSQARTKWWNRWAQTVLRDAEMWSVASGQYPRDELGSIWKTVLLNQFHDILPGSSIDWVYEQNVHDMWQAVV